MARPGMHASLGVAVMALAGCLAPPEVPIRTAEVEEVDDGGADASRDAGAPDLAPDLAASKDLAPDKALSPDAAAKRDVMPEAPRLPTFTNVARLFGICIGCHDFGSFDLRNDGHLYERLIDVKARSAACTTWTLVVPGQPDESLIYAKVAEGTDLRGCGGRMPSKCADNDPLKFPCMTTANIKLIRDWIQAGAPKN